MKKIGLLKRIIIWGVLLVGAAAVTVVLANWQAAASEKKMREHLIVATLPELQELAKKRDWDPEVMYWLGSKLSMEGNHGEAMKALARSAALNPNSSATFSMLGTELARLEKPQEAEIQLNKAISIAPNNAYAHYTLGCLYEKYNYDEKAVTKLSRSVELDPKNYQAQYLLALTYGKLSQYDKKLEVLQKLTKAVPDNIDYLKSYGYSLLFFSKFADAEQVYRHIIQVAPNDMETHYLLGRALAEEANTAEAFATAEVELKGVLAKVPENPGVHLALGILYFRQDKPEKAVIELEKVMKLGVAENKTYLYLGQTYIRLGRKVEGEKVLAEFQRIARIYREKSHLENRLLNTPPDTPTAIQERKDVRLKLAKVCMEETDYAAASRHLTLLIAEDKDNVEAPKLLKECQVLLQSPAFKNKKTHEVMTP